MSDENPKLNRFSLKKEKTHVPHFRKLSSSALSFKESPHFLVSVLVGELCSLVSPPSFTESLKELNDRFLFLCFFSTSVAPVMLMRTSLGVQQLHLGAQGLSLATTDPWR